MEAKEAARTSYHFRESVVYQIFFFMNSDIVIQKTYGSSSRFLRSFDINDFSSNALCLNGPLLDHYQSFYSVGFSSQLTPHVYLAQNSVCSCL